MIIGRQILHFPSLTSTSDKAAELAQFGEPEGTVVLTDEQSRGRGQRGAVWFSPVGGLYLSIILRPYKNSSILPAITILCAEAVVSCLKVSAQIKPPNDILVQGKKICGILTERKAGGYLVLGIGVNLNIEEFPAQLHDQAISLCQIRGKKIAANDFLTKLLSELDIRYSKFLQGKL